MSKKWYSYFVIADESEQPPAAGEPPVPAPRRAADLVPEVPTEANSARRHSSRAPGVRAAGSAGGRPRRRLRISQDCRPCTRLHRAEGGRHAPERAHPCPAARRQAQVHAGRPRCRGREGGRDCRGRRAPRSRARYLRARAPAEPRRAPAAKEAARTAQIEEEIAERVAELRARIDENTPGSPREQEDLRAWQARKQEEERRIAEAVSYFVSENPDHGATDPRPSDKGDANVRQVESHCSGRGWASSSRWARTRR